MGAGGTSTGMGRARWVLRSVQCYLFCHNCLPVLPGRLVGSVSGMAIPCFQPCPRFLYLALREKAFNSHAGINGLLQSIGLMMSNVLISASVSDA